MPDHKSRVEEYGNDLATMDEARRATISKERLGVVKDFWPGFAAAAGLLVVIGVSVLVPKLFRRVGPPAAPEKTAVIFRIDSVKIDDEPAQAFIFQTQDQGSTFVWVEKQL